MRLRASLLGLAAAWAVIGSGCEYWRNLTESKKEDRVDLVLVLKDAWTGEPVTSASCSLDGAPVRSADDEGQVHLPASPTGMKTVACSSPTYLGRSLTLDIRLGQGRFEIPLGRKGGADWYPEAERRIRMEMKGGNLRFPGVLQMQAFPADSVFKYAWTSTHHTGLQPGPAVSVPIDSQSGESFEVTLVLTATATLAGSTYQVGKDLRTFTLVRNQPPKCSVLGYSPSTRLRVGIGMQPDPYAEVHIRSWDPDEGGDGRCQCRLFSTDSTSPLGLIDTSTSCSQYQRFNFKIIQYDGLPDRSVDKFALLTVKATDANGGTRDTVLRMETYSNLYPEILLKQIGGGQERNLTNDSLAFQIKAWDRDAKMVKVTWDWKDGDSSHLSEAYLRDKDTLVHNLYHVYKQAGTYKVEARVKDDLNAVHTSTLTIEVVAD